MTESASNTQFNYLYSFPNPFETLNFRLAPLEQCLADGLVVLDANVLLLPFKTGPHALDEIGKALETLKDQKRLFVPKHALREYIANRPGKIKEFYDQLNKKRSKDFQIPSTSRLIEKSKSFDDLIAAEKAVKDEVDKLHRLIGAVIEEVRQWQTSDPVSEMYQRLLSAEMIFDAPGVPADWEKEHKERTSRGAPPGYKDGNKDKNNIGDFLIWNSILALGTANPQKSVVFVSGEEKADWVYRSANETLYAREELIEEYRRASNGGSFHLIEFTALLKHLKASPQTVAEVHFNEGVISDRTGGTATSSLLTWSEFSDASEDAVGNWLNEHFGTGNVIHQKSSGPLDFVAFKDDCDIFVEVRAIRHYQHFKKRINEVRMKLDDTVDSGPIRSEANRVIGIIFFVCEDNEGAHFIARAKADIELPSWLAVQSGFLADGKFVPVE